MKENTASFKDKFMGVMEKFSKAMVQPLMYLSAAGILIVVGVLITNKTISGVLPFLQWGPIQAFGQLIYSAVMGIINNLAVVFAIGIPAALAKSEKHKAAILGFMTYLMYLICSNQLLTMTGSLAQPDPMLGLYGTGQASILGIQCVDMSVFGGIMLGCIVGYVFNKTSQKRFKGAFQIYSGANWSLICLVFVAIVFAFVTNYVWPIVQGWILTLGNVIKNTGAFGLFLYGFLERILLPTGLHHLVYTPFQFTDMGGVIQAGENTIAGAYPIVMAEMNMPVEQFSDSIYYMSTGFTKMFGYIGIGTAFIYTAYPENRKKTASMIIPLVVTACLASITEPIDFMFLFAAPLLYLIHSVIAGVFMALLKQFGVIALWNSNLLTSIITNIANADKTVRMPLMFVLGIVQILVYFFVFSFMIKKFNYHTPGREGEPGQAKVEDAAPAAEPFPSLSVGNVSGGVAALSAAAMADDPFALEGGGCAMDIIQGLGGKENINSVENCITRLRVNLKNPDLINEDFINKTQNHGIVRKQNDIQVIYGLQVPDVRRAVEQQLSEL